MLEAFVPDHHIIGSFGWELARLSDNEVNIRWVLLLRYICRIAKAILP
jgi:hypothetical protein